MSSVTVPQATEAQRAATGPRIASAVLLAGFGGLAIHIGSRVAGHAGAGEILVSSTVKDLVAGSGLTFEDRGRHTLKGIPGEWQLYSAIQ